MGLLQKQKSIVPSYAKKEKFNLNQSIKNLFNKKIVTDEGKLTKFSQKDEGKQIKKKRKRGGAEITDEGPQQKFCCAGAGCYPKTLLLCSLLGEKEK